jgi:uroporphyrinogen III methyltransferase/synthase
MTKPLRNRTIVVTRSAEQGDELVLLLRQSGARVLRIPTIKIGPPDSWRACDAALARLHDFDWIIFTSVNGVHWFYKRLREKHHNLQISSRLEVAAVGEATFAALAKRGIQVDILPDEYRAEGLLRSFESINLQGGSLLLPAPQTGGRPILKEHLPKMGVEVVKVPVYKNRLARLQDAPDFAAFIKQDKLDLLSFTSPSTYKNFVSQLGTEKLSHLLDTGCRLAALGEVTSAAIVKTGFHVDIIPEKITIPAFHQAIVEYYA